MSGQYAEQFGGVLAAPPRLSRRRVIVRAVASAAALALAAAAVVILISQAGRGDGLIATLKDPGRSQGATSAAFSPDGKTLAILDGNGDTYLWDVATGRWTGTLASPQCQDTGGQVSFTAGERSPAAQVLFSPDGKTLAVVGAVNGDTCLWNLATMRQTAVLAEPADPGSFAGVTGGAFSPDGKILAIGDNETGSTYLWDVASRRQIATLTDPADSQGDSPDVEAVAFGPDGMLAAGDGNDNVYVWDTATGRLTGTLTTTQGCGGYLDTGGIESVAFSPDGTVAAGDGYGCVYLWDGATGQRTASITPPINVLEANSLYYSCCADVAGQVESGGGGPIGVTVAYSQNGRVLAAGVDYGYGTYVWNGDGTDQLATLTDPGGDNSVTPQLALSPDGTMLAVVDNNGRTYLWRLG
jgi:WD40 repeat protein